MKSQVLSSLKNKIKKIFRKLPATILHNTLNKNKSQNVNFSDIHSEGRIIT